MIRRRYGDGNGVVEYGGCGVSTPVDGIDTDVGGGDDGFDVLHILHGVVADGDTRVRLTLGGTYAAALRHVCFSHLISQNVGRNLMVYLLMN